MSKVPYTEFPHDAVIDVSDDEGDIEMMVEMGVMTQGDWTKNKVLGVAYLNKQLKEKMKEKMAAATAEHARNMEAFQDEIRASNAKQDKMFEMLSRMGSFAPHPAPYPYPPTYPSHQPPQGSYQAGPSSQRETQICDRRAESLERKS